MRLGSCRPSLAESNRSWALRRSAQTGRCDLNAEKLREAVLSGGELANTLLVKATGLPHARLESLSASQALSLLETAVELNFREEVLGKLRKVGAALRGTLTATAR